LCCSSWLNDFKSVNTTAARYQNLSINQSKLSGQCGRLKCCLNYELDTYLDALQHFPDNADTLQVAKGNAFLIKKDIFKNLMWYTLPDSSKQYPLTIERVRKIKQLNQQGIIPEELEAVEVISQKPKEVEPEFVDVVGQLSLRSLEKNDRKRKQQQQARNQQGRPQQPSAPNRTGGQGQQGQQRPPQGNRPPAAPQQQSPRQGPPRGPQQQRQQQSPQQPRPPQTQGSRPAPLIKKTDRPAGESPAGGEAPQS
jgi:hypothetical protein